MNSLEWNLEDIFKENEIEINIEKLEHLRKELEKYKGTLNTSENILNCYKKYCELLEVHEKLYAYAMLKYHKDMSNVESIKLYKRLENITAIISSSLAFITPEISKNSKEDLESFLKGNKGLIEFEKSIKDIIKDKAHILSEEKEELLAKFSEVFSASENIYDIFTNTELDFPSIKDENGNELKMNMALYGKYAKSSNENIRKQAFESIYSLYKKHINSITEMYLSRVKKATISSNIRNYKSSLDMATQNDDATINVYNALVESVDENLYLNHKYLKLKNKILNTEKMHMYDVYVNPLEKEEEHIEFEEAKETILNALTILGEEYTQKLKNAFNSNWMDVFEKENKMSGGYNLGVYGVHPFILLNYINSSRDVSTIAHELGHAMHSDYSSSSQNIINSNYTIMVAEVASTVNEILLANYLIEKEEDLTKKASLINEQLDMIRATLVRQTMFAEFEKIIHERIERGESQTSETLNETYFELVKKYFGEDVIFDEEIKYEWARIPHLYRCFYVYKYSTGISSAIAIASKILSKEDGYTEKYIEMLKQGGSKSSIELLKMVDVDLENKETYNLAFKYFEEKLNNLEKIVNKIK